MAEWMAQNWIHLIIPLLVFIEIATLGFLFRLVIYKIVKRRNKDPKPVLGFLIETIWHPLPLWFLLLGVYIACLISELPQLAKQLTGETVATLFIISSMWVIATLGGKFIKFYSKKLASLHSVTSPAVNVFRAIVAVIGTLVIFNVWGAPTQPLIIIFIAALFFCGLAFRNNLNRFIAGLEIIYNGQIQVGHLIKIESGEMGYVTQISRFSTVIKTEDGAMIIIPNDKLITNTVINYGAAAAKRTVGSAGYSQNAPGETRLIDALSTREREVLIHLGQGATNNEIASRLFLSEHTVKSHIRSILNKLNIRRRQDAAVYAEREGLLTPTDDDPKLPG
jgi:DNA-binding CsgD family transcriptional regulator/small-conductance mechanosensitive channel